MIEYHLAKKEDHAYLSEALLKLCQFIREHGSDPYAAALPTHMTDDLRQYAAQHIGVEDTFAFVAKMGTTPIGCAYGSIRASELPICYQQPVGHVAVAWVEQSFARRGVGTKLYEMCLNYLRGHQIERMELSYMNANAAAEQFWQRHGFQAFRSFAYKNINE